MVGVKNLRQMRDMFSNFIKVKTEEDQKLLNKYGAHNIVVPNEMLGWLRSDHAGETGAVWIYRAASLAYWSKSIRKMAREHLPTEKNHLVIMEHLVQPSERSKLLFLWRVMGFGLGFLSSIFGYSVFCITINAVETFVEGHYKYQITKLRAMKSHQKLLAVLIKCCDEEIHHREDAGRRIQYGSNNAIRKWWVNIIEAGSEIAVKVSNRV